MDDARSDVIREFLRRYREDRSSGTVRSLEEYQALWPGYEEAVAGSFEAVRAGEEAGDPDAGVYGPYRTLHELGRGGQATVYLAEDERLGRRVALKVLRRPGPDFEGLLRRFEREAAVTARLDHPSICTVHDTGITGGVAWIAMQYVQGETLARWIRAARSSRDPELSTVLFDDSDEAPAAPPEERPDSPPDTLRDRKHVLSVVPLVEEAARALHAAHEAGVTHRDVKPGNVMVTPHDRVVVLDFGLAQLEAGDQPTLTMTGDVMGTPAYMSPEQLVGRHMRPDRRTDVYSLGVVLFECLALERPFEAPTREALYQAILSKDPPDVRKLNPGVSRDLKVVCETALEKDRDRRYQTAAALADDLSAVLEGRPIAARPIGTLGRTLRWARREPAKAALLAVLLVALPTIATLLTAWIKDRPSVEAARRAALERRKDEILSRASYELSEGDARRAPALFEEVLRMEGGSPEAAAGLALAHLRLGRPDAALRVLDDYDALLGEGPAPVLLRADARRQMGREEEAATLEASAPPPRDALDHLMLAFREIQTGEAGEDAAFTRALRHATQGILLSRGPRLMLFEVRAHAAGHARDREAAIETAAALRARWPSSARAHQWAAFALHRLGDAALLDDVIAICRDALRLAPDDAVSHATLGFALHDAGRTDEALAAFREAVRIAPQHPSTHYNLGMGLRLVGRLEEATAAFREAVRLEPDDARNHANLGAVLQLRGLLDEAISACREAIHIDPDSAEACHYLGVALRAKGRLEQAIAAHREAVRLRPDDPVARWSFGAALFDAGRLDDAIEEFRAVLSIQPDDLEALRALGAALFQKGLVDEAIAAHREALRVGPDDAMVHYNLGIAYREKGRLEDAIAAYREAVRCDPELAEVHCNLGHALTEAGCFREALPSFERGHELGSRKPDWSYPSAQWVAKARENVARVERLEAHLADGSRPDSAAELADLARLALAREGAPVSVAWYRAAFEQEPALGRDLRARHRFFAARAAIRAAAVQGAGSVPDGVRAAHREEARRWLVADLDAYEDRLARGRLPPGWLARTLAEWRADPDLARTRSTAWLTALPEPERASWSALWRRVRELLQRVR